MNILVCVKQVPDTTEIRIDPVTNTLIRAGVPSIVNPFDAYALEMALRLREAAGGTVIVLSMGPEQAKNALKECLAIGADKAYLCSDRAFGGSDTLATSYILSRAIKALETANGAFDVIFCGKQAIDGDTAQVGPEIAEHLHLPQVTYAVETSVSGHRIQVKREVEEGFELVAVSCPCLITVTKPKFDPRYPTIRSRMAANRAEIPVLTSADLDIDLSCAGLKGSPTKVSRTFTPSLKQGGIRISEETGSGCAKELVRLLTERKII